MCVHKECFVSNEVMQEVTCYCGKVFKALKASERKFCCRKCFRKWYKDKRMGLVSDIAGHAYQNSQK